ncbi:hypothetical protein TB2_006240 [Malus domestica]
MVFFLTMECEVPWDFKSPSFKTHTKKKERDGSVRHCLARWTFMYWKGKWAGHVGRELQGVRSRWAYRSCSNKDRLWEMRVGGRCAERMKEPDSPAQSCKVLASQSPCTLRCTR